MVESTKFADFIETARTKLDLIRQSLLKREKNPEDREFLNDYYRSVRALKDASLPVGLGRFSELCFNLESILTVIRQNRLDIDPETISLLHDSKDRLSKLLHEIETGRQERATIKDLLKRIRKFEESVKVEESLEPAPEIEVLEAEDIPLEMHPDYSLLPEEIIKEEYDQELFQIFIEQMQENLSLLRSLTPFFSNLENRPKCAALCSELVGRLQSSANYMGYEKLADFYLQWIAELEMAGVDLAMGMNASFDFMDSYLKRITSLFPQIEDSPAVESMVNRVWLEFSNPPPPVKKKVPSAAAEPEDDSFRDLFNDIEDPVTVFDNDSEPVAALAGVEPQYEEQGAREISPRPKANTLSTTPIDIDGSFLEDERQSDAFDEELFQIFLQQLQDNLARIRALTDNFAMATNKNAVIDQCTDLVGNLQSSANYMGYKQLAEYHLQWIAELELAGVELSIGNSVDLGFINEKINKISEIFPEVKTISADLADFSTLDQETPATQPPESRQDLGATPGSSIEPEGKQAGDPSQSENEGDYLSNQFNDENTESFELPPEPVAVLAGDKTKDEPETPSEIPGPPGEEDIDTLFQPASRDKSVAVSEEDAGDIQDEQADELEILFGETDQDTAPPADTPPVREELLQKLSDALNSIDEEVAREPAPGPESSETENGSDLFDKLLSALDLSAGPSDDSTSSIDQIIDEILTGEQRPENTSLDKPEETAPLELPTPEIWHSLGLDAGKIDELVGKIGDLVAGRASLEQLYTEMNSLHHTLLDQSGLDSRKLAPFRELTSRLGNTNKALGRLFGEIRDGILKVRMTPVARIFELFSRFVEKLAEEAGKEIVFTTSGSETEVDQCSIENIANCLLILIRNAVEHGIESSLERKQVGKDPVAAVSISAYREHNHIVFEVTDDGRGIDPKKVKSVALARGLFSGDDLYNMSDHDLTHLIMTPGFTTYSGGNDLERGPGMDTLRETVDRLNGTIRITSAINKGTTIRICIPFTPPVFQAMRLRDGADTYTLPLVDIDELLRVSKDDIEKIDGVEMILFHGESIPVYALSDLVENSAPTLERDEWFYIVVVRADSKKVGLSIDKVLGIEDVSIRPLAEFLRKECGFSAAAIKGEGEILFIPDIGELVKKSALRGLNCTKQ